MAANGFLFPPSPLLELYYYYKLHSRVFFLPARHNVQQASDFRGGKCGKVERYSACTTSPSSIFHIYDPGASEYLGMETHARMCEEGHAKEMWNWTKVVCFQPLERNMKNQCE